MTELPTLTKRKLQAQVIGPIYAEMVEQLGEQRAGEILDSAIKKAAIAEGKSFPPKRQAGLHQCLISSGFMSFGQLMARLKLTCLKLTTKPSTSMSLAANMLKPTKKWASAKLATSCPATVMAPSAKVMTPTSP